MQNKWEDCKSVFKKKKNMPITLLFPHSSFRTRSKHYCSYRSGIVVHIRTPWAQPKLWSLQRTWRMKSKLLARQRSQLTLRRAQMRAWWLFRAAAMALCPPGSLEQHRGAWKGRTRCRTPFWLKHRGKTVHQAGLWLLIIHLTQLCQIVLLTSRD